MPGHRLYGFTVDSDIPLPELPAASGPARITIRRGTVAASRTSSFDIWPHSDGRSWVRATRTASGYQVRHGERAAFGVDRRLGAIVYDAPGCDEALLRHFLIDQVVPLMLSLDALVLHASSVAFAHGISAFVGPGGAGKSTLALALARAGHPIVSDDGLLLRPAGDRFTAVAAYPGVRLWDDSAGALAAAGGPSIPGAAANKSCYREADAFGEDTGTLSGIYVIDSRPAGDVAFERVSGADAVIEIVRQTYRLALDDRAALASQLDDIVRLTRAVPVWRLSFPRALAEWQQLAARVVAAMRGHAEVNT